MTRTEFVVELARIGAIRFGAFTLASGRESPVYVDLRLLAADMDLMQMAAGMLSARLESVEVDRLAAVPLAGLPIGTATALKRGTPLVYPRMTAKTHGRSREVEGAFETGETVAVIEDVITSGGSLLKGMQKLRGAGLSVTHAVVLLDRQAGGEAALKAEGVELRRVFTLVEVMDILYKKGVVDEDQYGAVKAFMAETRQ